MSLGGGKLFCVAVEMCSNRTLLIIWAPARSGRFYLILKSPSARFSPTPFSSSAFVCYVQAKLIGVAMSEEQDRFFTIPNIITCMRIVAAPLIVYMAFVGSIYTFLLFVATAVSDFFDGKIARRFNMVSDVGKSLDPFADKILVLPILALFLYQSEIGIPVFVFISVRETVVIVCRWLARQNGYATPSLSLGKWKANFEFIAIGFLLATPNQLGVSYVNDMVAFSGYQMHHIGALVLWAAAALAWLSLIQLWYAYRQVFLDEKGHY